MTDFHSDFAPHPPEARRLSSSASMSRARKSSLVFSPRRESVPALPASSLPPLPRTMSSIRSNPSPIPSGPVGFQYAVSSTSTLTAPPSSARSISPGTSLTDIRAPAKESAVNASALMFSASELLDKMLQQVRKNSSAPVDISLLARIRVIVMHAASQSEMENQRLLHEHQMLQSEADALRRHSQVASRSLLGELEPSSIPATNTKYPMELEIAQRKQADAVRQVREAERDYRRQLQEMKDRHLMVQQLLRDETERLQHEITHVQQQTEAKAAVTLQKANDEWLKTLQVAKAETAKTKQLVSSLEAQLAQQQSESAQQRQEIRTLQDAQKQLAEQHERDAVAWKLEKQEQRSTITTLEQQLQQQQTTSQSLKVQLKQLQEDGQAHAERLSRESKALEEKLAAEAVAKAKAEETVQSLNVDLLQSRERARSEEGLRIQLQAEATRRAMEDEARRCAEMEERERAAMQREEDRQRLIAKFENTRAVMAKIPTMTAGIARFQSLVRRSMLAKKFVQTTQAVSTFNLSDDESDDVDDDDEDV
eukprot:TRINITY_DN7581_c0_g1_i1.p1 TRINITY_DN7581_c0_g1~~TRINITY_DN7581_c0_g1_i1.p1  ORF type:complete len:538 (-),score=150.19 TRINITY_DN7581_c0_g1_i1:120-1733(-)